MSEASPFFCDAPSDPGAADGTSAGTSPCAPPGAAEGTSAGVVDGTSAGPGAGAGRSCPPAGTVSITLAGASARVFTSSASPSVQAKKTAARTAVVRDRKFAEPVAPNRLPEAPLPKAAPMSAPLPCCNRTSVMTPIALRTWIVIRRLVSQCMNRCASDDCRATADVHEILGHQRRPADEPAVDVRHREQAGGVGRLDAAAIQDADAVGGANAALAQARPDEGVHLLRRLRRGGPPGADRPDGLVGDDDAIGRERGHDRRERVDLAPDHRLGLPRFPLLEGLPDAGDHADLVGKR